MVKRQLFSTVGWRKYLDPADNPRVNRFLKKNGEVVFAQIVSNIETAIDSKQDEFIMLVHPNVSSAVSVKQLEYNELLNHCLTWYKKTENYEKCAEIIKIRKKLPPEIIPIILN